jgi:hypothetical protein
MLPFTVVVASRVIATLLTPFFSALSLLLFLDTTFLTVVVVTWLPLGSPVLFSWLQLRLYHRPLLREVLLLEVVLDLWRRLTVGSVESWGTLLTGVQLAELTPEGEEVEEEVVEAEVGLSWLQPRQAVVCKVHLLILVYLAVCCLIRVLLILSFLEHIA